MKKILFILFLPVILYSCNTSREAASSRSELKSEKKKLDALLVKNAVESRKYILKFNRIYGYYGTMIDLVPRSNYIIVDGEKAIINTAYVGRQWDIRPIAAINMRGRAVDYSVISKTDKGSFDIKMKVNNGRSVAFDVFITINKNGYCSASVSGMKIESIRYTGFLVPITEKNKKVPTEGDMI